MFNRVVAPEDLIEYLTVLPSREVLQAKVHQSIAKARQRMSQDRVLPDTAPHDPGAK